METPPGLGSKNARRTELRNSIAGLENEDDKEEVDVLAVDPALPLTRLSSIEFNVADVKKPLASAAKMVKSGNRVVLDSQGSRSQASAWKCGSRMRRLCLMSSLRAGSSGRSRWIRGLGCTFGPRTS